MFPEMEFFPIPFKAKIFVPILMIVELGLGINATAGDNIAHFAHIGGALFGMLLLLFWRQTGNLR